MLYFNNMNYIIEPGKNWSMLAFVGDTDIRDYDSNATLYYSNAPMTKIQCAMVIVALGWIDKKGYLTYAPPKKQPPKALMTSSAGPKPLVNDPVAALFTDGNYYCAVVKAVKGDAYDIVYLDGTVEKTSADRIVRLDPKIKLKVGEKVMASWGKYFQFFPGTVQKLEKDGALIEWADGSEPSLVEYSKIYK